MVSQSLSEGTARLRRLVLTLVVTLSTAVFVALHWRGIPLSPDGWAYWQAAVSLANGTGYRDFSGVPLTAWPPLYSFYLSLWVRALGATGLALVVANSVLIVGQSVLWFHTAYRIWSGEPKDQGSHAMLAVALYIALYVPLTLQAAHSANLGFLCASAMIVATWETSRRRSMQSQSQWLTISIVAAILSLLAHNINLALTASCASALLITRHNTPRDFMFAAGLLIVPVAAWLAVRWYLGQLGSHSVGIGISNFSAIQYAKQMAFVIGNLIVPSAFGAPFLVSSGLLAWCLWALFASEKHQHAGAARFTAVIVLISSGSTLLLFSLTSVTDPIGARFVGWIPILIVPAMLMYAARLGRFALLIATFAVLTPNVHRFVIFSTIHADQRPQKEVGVVFPISAFISPNYTSGAPTQTRRRLLVAPP